MPAAATLNYAGSFAKAGTLARCEWRSRQFQPGDGAGDEISDRRGRPDATTPEVVYLAVKEAAPATLKVRVSDGEASSATGNGHLAAPVPGDWC